MKKRYVVTRADGTQISVMGDYLRIDPEIGAMIHIVDKDRIDGSGHHEIVAVLNIAEIVCVVSADACPAGVV